MAGPSQAEIEAVIIELLAEDAGMSPADLRTQMQQEGPGLPVDSLLAAEVLVRVETKFGVRLPTDQSTANAMGSVTAFAGAVLATITSSGEATSPAVSGDLPATAEKTVEESV